MDKLCALLESVCPHQEKNDCDGCELHEVYLDYRIMSNKVKRDENKREEDN